MIQPSGRSFLFLGGISKPSSPRPLLGLLTKFTTLHRLYFLRLDHETNTGFQLTMDFSLRCNSLKCRTQLQDRAVVTTCSHIFCVPCSETLGLASPNGARVCPACETQLANPDDAVVTQLNPTEDYKTSVLSGLSPSIIMECAGRGLSFYSYQTTQEM